MRNFFTYNWKNKVTAVLLSLYICSTAILSYCLAYNEFYAQFHQGQMVSSQQDDYVYPVGKIVGIYTECHGVFVIDSCKIETAEGDFICPAGTTIRTGDYIVALNGTEIFQKETLIQMVGDSKGESLELTIERGTNTFTTTVTPRLGKNGSYMLGIWVKDDLAGVGTMTYVTSDGSFGALGHGMSNGVDSELFSVDGGDIYVSKIIGIDKGRRGEPGEVKGVLYYGKGNHLGEVSENTKQGIYGVMDAEDIVQYTTNENACKIGQKETIHTGAAQIVSDVSGKREYYDIEITYVDYLATSSNKGLHIKVTDENLLELTGGIVQGMSGSPIIQDGKLVGAVTHVLVNDPTRGYGIFIENMLDAGE